MEVVDRLAAMPAAIDDHPVPGAGQPLALGDPGGRHQKVAQEFGVRRSQFRQAGDVPTGDDQDVGGGLRVDVPESQDLVVAEYLG